MLHRFVTTLLLVVLGLGVVAIAPARATTFFACNASIPGDCERQKAISDRNAAAMGNGGYVAPQGGVVQYGTRIETQPQHRTTTVQCGHWEFSRYVHRLVWINKTCTTTTVVPVARTETVAVGVTTTMQSHAPAHGTIAVGQATGVKSCLADHAVGETYACPGRSATGYCTCK